MQYKILAVDDNPINLKLLSRVLVNSSYQILTAENGQRALDIAFAEKPDLILLDVMMPEMDGYDVCKKLHENEDTSYIPVIFLSAKNESIDKARGLALGAVDYLTKPFDPLEINARVRTHLSANQTTIKLLHKNQQLQLRLDDLTQKLAQNESGMQTQIHLDKLNQCNYHIDDERLELLAMTKSLRQPVTSKLIPLLHDRRQLLYLLMNGFEKNYPTLHVQMLLEKYVEGFIQAFNDKSLSGEDVSRLVEMILDKFSPDVYEVAFTFAMGLIDYTAGTLHLYSVHQPLPFIIDVNYTIKSLTGEHLNFIPSYAEVVSAFRSELPAGSIICYYRQGVQAFDESIYHEHYLKAFVGNELHLQKSIIAIDEEITATGKDQLIAAIHLKSQH